MSRQLYRADAPGDLTPAQRGALRYFGIANRFSRTVNGFADYHATTKSSASEIVSELVRRGLVTRTPWPEDRRRVRIDLTEEGREQLANDPVLDAAEALRELPGSLRDRLLPQLKEVAAEIGRRTEAPSFGVCANCEHAEVVEGEETPYYCCYYDTLLSTAEAERLCSDAAPTG